MAFEIGTAFVTVEADTSKVSSQISNAFRGQGAGAMRGAGSSIGGSLLSGIRGSLSTGAVAGVVGGVTSSVTSGMIGLVGNTVSHISGLVENVGGLVAHTVLDYNSELQNANIGFTTMLGSGAKAKGFLDNLQNFAKSTPFEFGNLVHNAQNMMGMGIAAKDVIPDLKALGDSVASIGGSAQQVDSVTLAFDQMNAKGTLDMGNMNQLMQNGVPSALKVMAAGYHVTTGEMIKMISTGKVQSSVALPMLVKGIEKGTSATAALGGMMDKQSQTFTGALSNIQDGLTQTVSKAFKPFFDIASSGMQQFATALSGKPAQKFQTDVTAALKPLASAIGGWFKTIDFNKIFSSAGSSISGFLKGINFKDVIGGLQNFGKIAGDVFKTLVQVIPPVVTAIMNIVPVVVSVVKGFMDFAGPILKSKDALILVVGALAAFKLAAVGMGVVNGIMTAWSNATKIATGVQWLFNAAMDANPIGIVVVAIAGLVAGLVWFFTQTKVGQTVWANFTKFLSEAWNNIVKVAQVVFPAIGKFIADVWNSIVSTTRTVWNNVVGFIKTVITNIHNTISTIFNAIKALNSSIWNGIKSTISNVVNGIRDTVSNVFNAIKGVASSVWNGIKNTISNAVNGAKNIVSNVINGIKSIWSNAFNAIKTATSAIFNGIKGAVTAGVHAVVNTVQTIRSGITTFFSNAGSWLLSAGKNIISGLIKGITGAVGGVTDAIGGLASGVINTFAGGIKSHSPSRVFIEFGKNIGQGLIHGIFGIQKEVDSAVQQTAQSLIDKTTKVFNDLPGKITKAQTEVRNSIIDGIKKTTSALNGEALKRNGIIDSLGKEKDALAAAKQARTDYADGVKASIVALGSVTGAVGTTTTDADGTSTTAAVNSGNIISNLQSALAKTNVFKSDYDRLKRMGLDNTTLQQITASFQQNGDTSYADALVSGGQAAVNQVKALQTQLAAAGASLGSDASHKLYDAGVATAQGLVNGLKSQLASVDKTMEDMAERMIKKIKKKLKINSPSRVFSDEVGKMLPLGVIQGIQANQGALDNTVNGMVSTPVVGGGLTSIAAKSSTSPTGGDVYITATIDAGNVSDFNNVVEIFSGIAQTARQGRGNIRMA